MKNTLTREQILKGVQQAKDSLGVLKVFKDEATEKARSVVKEQQKFIQKDVIEGRLLPKLKPTLKKFGLAIQGEVEELTRRVEDLENQIKSRRGGSDK